MTDERKDSTEHGIAPPPESDIGRKADEQRQQQVTTIAPDQRPDSAMGGTSDSDSPADEAWTPRR